MKICYDLGSIFSQSNETENAYALKASLDYLIKINMIYLKFARQPVPRLYKSGVHYGRTEVWEAIPALYKRGYGDCKSLTAALVAEYRMRGIKAYPVFRFEPNKRGGNNFHILVLTPDHNGIDKKQFEDPSRKLGMGQNRFF